MFPYDTQTNYPQLQDQLQKMMMPQPTLQQTHVVRVNGRPGAESFNMAPNSDAILLDMNDPIAWFVMTDGAGYKTITPYDISIHKETSQTDLFKSLEDRISRLEEEVRNGKSNFKPNYAKSNKSEQQHNDAGGRSNA